MIIDFKSNDLDDGFYDIKYPFETITNDDLFFQQIELLLETHLNEWVYDTTQGLEYDILNGRDIDYRAVETEFYNKISKLIYFGKLDNFKIETDENRQITVSFTAYSNLNNTQEFEVTI